MLVYRLDLLPLETALCPRRFNNKTVLLKTLATFQFETLAVARAFTQ